MKKSSNPPRFVGTSEIAERLRLTPRRIQRLVGEGLPRVSRGRYNVDTVLDWYIGYLERRLASGTDEQLTRIAAKHRLRLSAAKADLREMAAAVLRGELVMIAPVEKHMMDLVIATRARILTVPARVSGELVGEQSRTMAQAKVEKALNEALAPLLTAIADRSLLAATADRPGLRDRTSAGRPGR